jgi:CHAT domain-containing protein/tetratricopeptide (TPR) repeat protein
MGKLISRNLLRVRSRRDSKGVSPLKRIAAFIVLSALGILLVWGRAIAAMPSSPTPQAASGLSAPTVVSEPVASEAVTSQQLISEQFASDEERALNLYRTGDFAAAVQVWQDIADRSTDGIDRAIALGNLSLCWQKLGQWDAATKAIAQSWQQMSAAPSQPDTLQIQAQLLNIQGRLDFSVGDYGNALDRWKESEELYEQLGDRNRAARSQLNQVQAMQGLGLYRRAEKTLAGTIAQLNEQPDSALKAAQWRSLGNILRILGHVGTLDAIESPCQLRIADLQQTPTTLSAATAWQQSLAIAQRLNLPDAASEAYLGLGNVARAIYQREAGLQNASHAAPEAAQMAIACYQNAANAAAPAIRVRAQLNTMNLLLEQAEDADSEVELSRIQSQLNEIDRAEIEATLNTLPPGRTEVDTRIELARNLMKLAGQEDSPVADSPIVRDAQRLLLAAVERANTLSDPRVRSQALGTLGEFYSMQRDWGRAKPATEQALAIAQSIQADDLSYQWLWQLGRILKTSLNKSAQPDTLAAIAAYDGAVKTLQSLRRDLVAIEQEAQFDFRDRVEPVYREFVDLLLQSPNPSQANLRMAREAIEGLQLAELDNFFRDACSKSKPQPIEQIDASAVAIYGIMLDDRLEVIVRLPQQTDGELFHYRTPIPKAELVRTIADLRVKLETLSPRERPATQQLSQQIYNGLLAPALAQLQGEETLVFVLDGELRTIPMAALYDGKQYLIERHPVAIEPGLHLLDPQPLSRPFNALLAGLSQPPDLAFSPLPNVPRELQIIEEIIKTSGGTVSNKWLDGDFTRQNLENRVGSEPLQLVHLATHGQFSSQAENTFFLASDGPINIKQLEPIFGSRNPRQSKSIDLLFISACETASGDDRAVLGLAGVAVRSSARSTIASLWSLSDKSATEFISTFYQELVAGTPRAEALRRAQLNFLKGDTGRNAPLYWASYVLLGDWR